MNIDDKKARQPRYTVTMFIGGHEIGSPLGHSKNLSVTGMLLATDERPPLDSQATINIAWGREVYECDVRVVRHADDGIGIEFVEPDTQFTWAINEIISESE